MPCSLHSESRTTLPVPLHAGIHLIDINMQYQLFSLAALAVAYAYAQEDSTASGSSDAAELFVQFLSHLLLLPPPHFTQQEKRNKKRKKNKNSKLTLSLTPKTHSLSVVSVLQTALPSSLINEALTNSAGVSSQLASEFAAGETPAWFTALPTAVQTYLIPAFANATGTMSTAGTGALMTTTTPATATATATASSVGGSGMTGNGTSSAFVSSSSSSSDVSSSRMSTVMTESGKIGASATGTRGSSSSSSEAGAAMPTGVAMGLAGMAAGIMGVMAL